MLTTQDYIYALLLGFMACLFLCPAVIYLAKKIKAIDRPGPARKIHVKPTPLLGGVAIFAAFSLVAVIYYFYSSALEQQNLLPKHLFGVLIGGLILMIGGFLDDKYTLRPSRQILFPIAAISAVIISGIGINIMANPLTGGIFHLDKYVTILFWFQGLPYKLTILADLFTFFWLLGMTYTTKILDGLDGLVSGLAVIGGIFIFLTSLNKEIVQSDIALLAIILVGCYLAFLLFNFNPAKIFLGEGGSTYAGFMLGVLSIISGSKVAVTLILMGIPILDVAWTIIRRLMEKKNPFRSADKKHLHHRLLAAGFSVKQAVLFLYLLAIIFGGAALILQQYSFGLLILGLLVLISFVLIMAILYKFNKNRLLAAIDEK